MVDVRRGLTDKFEAEKQEDEQAVDADKVHRLHATSSFAPLRRV